MKLLLALGLITTSLGLTGCNSVSVERHHVVRSGYYGNGHYASGYYGSGPYRNGYSDDGYYGSGYGGMGYGRSYGRSYGSGYGNGYYGQDPYRRSSVVVVNRSNSRQGSYYGSPRVSYQSDSRGRYYMRQGKRVYVSVGL